MIKTGSNPADNNKSHTGNNFSYFQEEYWLEVFLQLKHR